VDVAGKRAMEKQFFCLIVLTFDLCRSWRRTIAWFSSPQSARWRLDGSSPLPFARPVPRESRPVQRNRQRREQKKRAIRPLLLACRCHEWRGVKEQPEFFPVPHPSTAPSASASPPRSSYRSRRSRSSHSDTSIPASSSSSTGGTSLPTSVAVRKSSTAFPHLLSPSRSQIFQRPLHLPVSFCTSAQRTFCCTFHSGHALKRWSLVCEGHLHHQHWASGRTLAVKV